MTNDLLTKLIAIIARFDQGLTEGLLHLECGEKACSYNYPLPYFNCYLYYTIKIFICQENVYNESSNCLSVIATVPDFFGT